ncbi:OsmC family protein [Brachybacterium sp. J153]|uniref:OsmC family protein n=1 Tax=Brachybacterium sp. J153 TaxID=3116488 RepID=UPI002E792BD4|nr:osmotically inducible protein C [Brachybacterium sp. J153]MEE1617328.1 osmotically inducible protein C [Brachybacterium sp. J153]
MPTVPVDTFDLPEDFGPGSVWADRTGARTLVGRNQRGVEIRIGHGEGEINPGELLKLALIGCAGMSSDVNLARRLGEDFPMRLWAHGTSDPADNRYHRVEEQVQLPLEGLSPEQIATVVKVFSRAVAAGCTVERSVVPGLEVAHRVLGAETDQVDAEAGPADAETGSEVGPTGADARAEGEGGQG